MDKYLSIDLEESRTMAATTTPAAPIEAAPNTLPTDDQILAQLAILQSLHSKIFQLRSLLPERLIDPVKAAVEASRSGYEPPAVLAAHLRSVAVDGDKDVKDFKERWRSEETRGVWRASKESAFPQGSDVWSIDYEDLVGGDGVSGAEGMDAEVGEDVEKVFESFKAENPKIKLEMESNGEGRIVADVTLAGQSFTITQPSRVEGAQPEEWLIAAKAGSQVTERSKMVLRSLHERPRKTSLKLLLVGADFLHPAHGMLTFTGHDCFLPGPEDTTMREMQEHIRQRCPTTRCQDSEPQDG